MSGAGLTAGHVAVAVVAACRMTGCDPSRVFEPQRGNKRVRLIAAAGLMAAMRLKPRDVCGVFQIDPTRLAPSMLRNADITTDDLLTIAESLRGVGMMARSRAPSTPQAPAASADTPAHKSTTMQARPDRPQGPVTDSPRRGRSRSQATTNPVRAPSRPPGRGGVAAVKPISDAVVGWARAYVARGVSVEELADLFDVDPDALDARLNPEMARAA